MAENLDHLLAVHHFLHEALCARYGYLLLQKIAGGAAAHIFGNKGHNDHSAHHHQRQPDAVIQHYAKDAQQSDGRHQQ